MEEEGEGPRWGLRIRLSGDVLHKSRFAMMGKGSRNEFHLYTIFSGELAGGGRGGGGLSLRGMAGERGRGGGRVC